MTEVWSVPYVGTVVNGILNSGRVKTGDSILFGPDSNGHFQQTVVRSMQRKRFCDPSPCLLRALTTPDRVDVASAEAGQCVALALKRVKRAAVRKGMVIVHRSETPPKGTNLRGSPQTWTDSLQLLFDLKDRCSYYSKLQSNQR